VDPVVRATATATAAALLVMLASGCQKGKASVPAAYRTDIENACNAEERSGALAPGQDPNQRSLLVATWMARSIKTDEARRFLASLANMPPAKKGDALRAEATRAGLPACPTAETWK
jgi:hypothetical protein